MDAVRYLKESERMCACCEGCEGCEIKERVGQENSCIDFESANPESAVAIVEKMECRTSYSNKCDICSRET